ncbi:hypothetical protein L0U95_32600 (plasmid) [Burkholderia cenocepacia]|uniref:hypothetical protein n=1 Tax=Burkholderia cenocepacia TaxID=95486 RepID=UPI001F2A5BAB|nr:hypothetical protein [Burkholderia cenocepacia]UJH78497.1 hypothetical protein L0U95_32600 [Burkholderia cenocepacia]
MLRIFDQKWIQSHRSNSMRHCTYKLPSIQSDREKIKFKIDKNGNIPKTWDAIMHMQLGHRAIIRDSDWLATIKSQMTREASNENNVKNELSARFSERVSLLLESMRLLSHEFGRPHTIHITDLARMTNLTVTQAANTIHQHTELHSTFKSINSNLTERKLQWAFEQLISKHTPITENKIIEKAKLWRTNKSKFIAKRIISEHQASSKLRDHTDLIR